MEQQRCDSNFDVYYRIGGEVLDLLLKKLLPLSKGITGFIREVLQFILRSTKNFLRGVFSSSDQNKPQVDKSKLEACAKNIRTIMNFFEKGEEERRLFKIVFPRWKGKREENIAQLEKIADSIHTSKKACSTAQIVGGSIGVVGGVALVGALLFPPAAAFVLPGFLGGAAATALLPTFLLPAAVTSVSTGVAIGGGTAVAAGGVTQLVSSATEIALLTSRIDEAKAVCERDKETFDFMMKWFRHKEDMENALKNIFGRNVAYEAIFGDIMEFCGMEEFDESDAHFTSTLKRWSGKIMSLLAGNRDPYFQAVITSLLFVVFVIEKRNRFLLNCIIAVQRVGLVMVATLEAGVEVGRLATSAFVKSVEVVPREIGRRVAVGVFACVGIALDSASIVLNSIDLANGSKSEEQESVLKVVGMMKDELETLEKVYQELRRIEQNL